MAIYSLLIASSTHCCLLLSLLFSFRITVRLDPFHLQCKIIRIVTAHYCLIISNQIIFKQFIERLVKGLHAVMGSACCDNLMYLPCLISVQYTFAYCCCSDHHLNRGDSPLSISPWHKPHRYHPFKNRGK